MKNSPEKKIFLIVSADGAKVQYIKEIIEDHFSSPTIFTAGDGATAVSKVENALPQVLITEMILPKMTGIQLSDQIMATKGTDATALIIVGHPPKEELYLDELVTGKVQFLPYNFDDEIDNEELTHCLVKALNFSSHQEEAEFYLKFLAPGDLLLKDGDKADYVYFVRKGELKAFKEVEGQEVTLGKVSYGEFVGEMAYINGEPRSANVVAESDCELIQVPIHIFGKVLFTRPAWSKALMLTLSKRVKAANENRK